MGIDTDEDMGVSIPTDGAWNYACVILRKLWSCDRDQGHWLLTYQSRIYAWKLYKFDLVEL